MPIKKYDPSFCELIVKLAKTGLCIFEIAESLDVTRETIYEWARKYPDFAESKDKAMDFHVSHLCRIAKSNLSNKDFREKTFDLMFINATHYVNYRTIAKINKAITDPVEKLDAIVDSVISGEILPNRAEVIANLTQKICGVDKKLAEMVEYAVNKKLSSQTGAANE